MKVQVDAAWVKDELQINGVAVACVITRDKYQGPAIIGPAKREYVTSIMTGEWSTHRSFNAARRRINRYFNLPEKL